MYTYVYVIGILKTFFTILLFVRIFTTDIYACLSYPVFTVFEFLAGFSLKLVHT